MKHADNRKACVLEALAVWFEDACPHHSNCLTGGHSPKSNQQSQGLAQDRNEEKKFRRVQHPNKHKATLTFVATRGRAALSKQSSYSHHQRERCANEKRNEKNAARAHYLPLQPAAADEARLGCSSGAAEAYNIGHTVIQHGRLL